MICGGLFFRKGFTFMSLVAKPLALLLNHKIVYEYDRNQRLPGKQREFLDFMDKDMEQGFELDGEFHEQPTAEQKMAYVAASMVHAQHDENNELLKATSAWLALRAPELVRLFVEESGDEFTLQFEFAKQEPTVDDTSAA